MKTMLWMGGAPSCPASSRLASTTWPTIWAVLRLPSKPMRPVAQNWQFCGAAGETGRRFNVGAPGSSGFNAGVPGGRRVGSITYFDLARSMHESCGAWAVASSKQQAASRSPSHAPPTKKAGKPRARRRCTFAVFITTGGAPWHSRLEWKGTPCSALHRACRRHAEGKEVNR